MKGLHSESWSKGKIPRCGGRTYCLDVLKFIDDMVLFKLIKFGVDGVEIVVVAEKGASLLTWVFSSATNGNRNKSEKWMNYHNGDGLGIAN